MAICITIAIEKGGVGKTATTVNLAAAMAKDGKRVLVVDTDVQANSTFFLTGHTLMENHYPKTGLFDMVRAFGIVETKAYITPTQFENIDVIVSNKSTPLLPNQLATLAESNEMKETDFLWTSLSEVDEDYDYILIDTPPAHDNILVQSAMIASDYVIIPVKFDEQCMQSLVTTYNVMKKLEQDEDIEINLLGILPTIVERTALTNYYKEELNEGFFKEKVFKTHIRKGNAINESSLYAKPCVLGEKTRNSKPAKDYLALYEEIKVLIEKDMKGE